MLIALGVTELLIWGPAEKGKLRDKVLREAAANLARGIDEAIELLRVF
jgi:hypothetical protein